MTPHQNRAMLDRDDQTDPAVGTWDMGTYRVPTFPLADLLVDHSIDIYSDIDGWHMPMPESWKRLRAHVCRNVAN